MNRANEGKVIKNGKEKHAVDSERNVVVEISLQERSESVLME